jgi:uncharacterized membrane protein YdjX (TVP38/TMEM64 family)
MPSLRLLGLGAAALCAFAVAALLLPHSPDGLHTLLLTIGPAAPAIALAAWLVLVPALFPATVLAAACGLTFGAVGGGAISFAGAVVGGLAAFALARGGARDTVTRLVLRRPRLARAHALLERRGFATMLAARLAPGVPAGWLHYCAGVAPVRTRAFAAAIAIGALLRTVPYAVLGQGIGSGSLVTVLVAAGSILLGGLAATLLVRSVVRAAPAPA